MVDYRVCRHWDVSWHGARECRCTSCGKWGYWTDGFVLWQRHRIHVGEWMEPYPVHTGERTKSGHGVGVSSPAAAAG